VIVEGGGGRVTVNVYDHIMLIGNRDAVDSLDVMAQFRDL